MDRSEHQALPSFDTRSCIHCGMCLQACPTYVQTGNEAHSPRGRIYSLRAVAEGKLTWKDIEQQMDSCLGCLACLAACPSHVRYEEMLAHARAEAYALRSAPDRAARWAIVAILQSPTRFRRLSRIANAPVLRRLLRALPPARYIPSVPKPTADRDPMPPLLAQRGPPSLARPTETESAAGLAEVSRGQRGQVALWLGCVQRVVQPEVNRSAIRCLLANGFEVIPMAYPECCGALAAHYGDTREAISIARRVAEHCPKGVPLVTTAAGCGTFLRAALRNLGVSTYDFAAFLHEQGWVAPLRPQNGLRVALHDACHLEHGQGVKTQPRELLSLIPGIQLFELDENYCCGSAGLYNVFHPTMAHRLLRRKVDAILRTGADTVLSSNVGCTLWMRRGFEERGASLRVLHLAELLAEALGPEDSPTSSPSSGPA